MRIVRLCIFLEILIKILLKNHKHVNIHSLSAIVWHHRQHPPAYHNLCFIQMFVSQLLFVLLMSTLMLI